MFQVVEVGVGVDVGVGVGGGEYYLLPLVCSHGQLFPQPLLASMDRRNHTETKGFVTKQTPPHPPDSLQKSLLL